MLTPRLKSTFRMFSSNVRQALLQEASLSSTGGGNILLETSGVASISASKSTSFDLDFLAFLLGRGASATSVFVAFRACDENLQ